MPRRKRKKKAAYCFFLKGGLLYSSLLGVRGNTCKISRPRPAADTERNFQMTVGLLEEAETLKVAVQVGSSFVPRVVVIMLLSHPSKLGFLCDIRKQ